VALVSVLPTVRHRPPSRCCTLTGTPEAQPAKPSVTLTVPFAFLPTLSVTLLECLRDSTVKFVALTAVPPGVVTAIGPVTAAAGTVAVIWAKTGAPDDVASIRGFIVPTATPGYAAKDQKGKLSLRASDTSEIHLEDVRLPKDAILPKTGGIKSPLSCLTQARYGIAWGAIGAAMACYDEAVRYAKDRVMFGKPIGATQIQQVRLAEMLTEITKAQCLVLQLGRLKDAGSMTPQQVSLAKRNNVNMACECAREARRLLGANGILVEYHSMRHLANLESVYTYEGTHDMHSLILGEQITGLAAF